MFCRIKICCLLLLSAAVFYAAADDAPVTALETLRKENNALREKLIAQGRELALMRQWLAGIISGEKMLDKDRAAELRLQRLESVSKNGMTLALKSDAVSKLFRNYLRTAAIGEAERIKYIIQLDELDAAARNFSGSVVSPKLTEMDLRVIMIDSKLQIAVVSGGMRSGIFPGMFLYPSNDRSGELQLRVISVRPGACAVDMVRGSWNKVVPGMALTPFRRRVETYRR